MNMMAGVSNGIDGRGGDNNGAFDHTLVVCTRIEKVESVIQSEEQARARRASS